MPFVKVYTTVERAQVDSKRALAAFTTALATAFERGEAFVMVQLEPELELSMGQSTEPCAFLQVRNHGALNHDRTPIAIQLLTEVAEKELQVPANRVFVSLEEIPRANCGVNGKPLPNVSSSIQQSSDT